MNVIYSYPRKYNTINTLIFIYSASTRVLVIIRRHYNDIAGFGPANCTFNNKYPFVIYDVPPKCFDLYKAIREIYTKTYKYSKFCPRFFHSCAVHLDNISLLFTN